MRRIHALFAVLLLAPACDGGRRYDQAIAVLIDVSGTYADQRPAVVNVVKREVLPALLPGDTLIVIRIDSDSYGRENVDALVTLDPRPSR
ncbi:MAG: VWA domain-containing protein, partial [Deltaproteobacteria bacterium]